MKDGPPMRLRVLLGDTYGYRGTVFSDGYEFYLSGLDLSMLEVRLVRRSHSGFLETSRESSWKTTWK